jgi:hypothetical protein
MKTTLFALSLLGLFLVPTGAFAHDKHHKHHDRDRDCDRDRYHGYYRCEPRGYYYDNYRPYGYTPRYYYNRPYDCDRRDYGFGGFRLWIR